MAVAALKNFIGDSLGDSEIKINIRAVVNLNEIWESIVRAGDDALKSNAWIVNCTLETVQFYVYNSGDRLRLISAHTVDAQPGENIEVHGGFFQRRHEDLVVYKENRGTAYNVKKNHLYFWTGSAMITQTSTMEQFKNQYHDPRKQLAIANNRNNSCCCVCL